MYNVQVYIHVQWNLSNLDNIGPDQSVLNREVSLISEVVRYMTLWTDCGILNFRGVLIEGDRHITCMCLCSQWQENNIM